MTLDERELFDIFSGISTPVIVLRGDRAVYANDAARALFGQDAGSSPADRFIPPELREGDWSVATAEIGLGEGTATVSLRRLGELIIVTAGRENGPEEEMRALSESITGAVLNHLSVCTLTADLISDRARSNADVTCLSYVSMLDRALHGIARVANNAARLFNGFEGEYHFTVLDLGEVVGDLVNTTAVLARQNGVEFKFIPPNTTLIYRADQEKLELLLMELISNSLRHTAPGGTVTVAVRAVPAGTLITVSDTGDGVSGSALDHIFSRYSRPKGGDPKAGAGMGLALAQSIAQAHSGRIIVDSSPSGGAVVTLSLPPSGLTGRDIDLGQPAPRSGIETLLTQYADVLDSSVYSGRNDM